MLKVWQMGNARKDLTLAVYGLGEKLREEGSGCEGARVEISA